MTEALANLEGVTVQFDDRLVVNRVSLTVHRGDIITIIGPNGAGKTTLIKTVLGLQRATSGKVSRAPGLVIGYVPQHLTLEATLPLSVRRFMLLSGKPLAECEAALARTGVSHLLEASVHHLSGGEKQRLLLARALVRKPDLRPGRTVRTDPGAAGRTALRRHHDLPRFAPGDGCHRQGDLPEPARLLQRLSGGYFPRPSLYRNLRPPGGGIAGGVSPPP